MSVAVVVEGDTDIPYARKLLASAGLEIGATIDSGGKHELDAQLAAYNRAASGFPWFVLRDLDADAKCAPSFLTKLQWSSSRWMCFRLAVREIESWILADAEGVSDFFSVRPSAIPSEPDLETDPTRTLVNLCRKSRRGPIRNGMAPKPGMSVSVGPLYEALIIEFGECVWNLDRACKRSDSLLRARRRLEELGKRWGRALEGR
jgi:hypothetical protein